MSSEGSEGLRRAVRIAARYVPACGALLAALIVLVLSVAFWKARIFDRSVNPTIKVGPVDLYVEVTPMNVYGFGALKHGPVSHCARCPVGWVLRRRSYRLA